MKVLHVITGLNEEGGALGSFYADYALNMAEVTHLGSFFDRYANTATP